MKMCKSFFAVCFSIFLDVFSEMEKTEGTFTFNWSWHFILEYINRLENYVKKITLNSGAKI